jgi:biopolymer transport protein ExbD
MKTETGSLMLRKSRPPAKLFSGFDTLQFASVMGLVVFVILLIFMTIPTSHHGVSVDLPKVLHPISMRNALREDAMKVSILRDGKVYFDSDQINVVNLPAKIQDHLKDREAERKVYVVADKRARWSDVEMVLDGVRSAGILRVAFLVN